MTEIVASDCACITTCPCPNSGGCMLGNSTAQNPVRVIKKDTMKQCSWMRKNIPTYFTKVKNFYSLEPLSSEEPVCRAKPSVPSIFLP